MGLFSFLSGGKKKTEQPLLSQTQNNADEELYSQLLDTIVPSVPVRDEVKKQVTKAFEKPEFFYDESGEYMPAIRGLRLSKHMAVTPKYVFIDALIEAQQMAEVDWKEDEAEIRRWIAAIMKSKEFPFSISEEEQYEDLHAGDIIQMIDDIELLPNGYSLQILDIQSDCYVFTVVPLADKKKVKQMFSKL